MMKVLGALCVIATLTSAGPAVRLSLADWNSYNFHEPAGPGTYAFGYDVDDAGSGNVQFRNEERHPNGTVTGSYGYAAPDGGVRIVRYVADRNGYRATEENSMKLSMLKPVRYPDTPFYLPHNTYNYDGSRSGFPLRQQITAPRYYFPRT